MVRASRSKSRGSSIASEGEGDGGITQAEAAEAKAKKSKRAKKPSVSEIISSKPKRARKGSVTESVESITEATPQGEEEEEEEEEDSQGPARLLDNVATCAEDEDEDDADELFKLAPGRTSELHAPNMLLSGHDGVVYSCAFDPYGKVLASGSKDKNIFLWEVFGEECANFNVLKGHKGAVVDVKWLSKRANASSLVSCSADKTVSIWDAEKGTRLRKFDEHGAIVNCCNVDRMNPHVVSSGSDDCTAIMWDIRGKDSISMYHDYQVTAVAIADDGNIVYTGGIDNIIRKWDLRKGGEPDGACLSLRGHSDTITGLAVSRDNKTLLSNSMDCSLRAWNIQPFVAGTAADEVEQGAARYEKLFQGHHHGAEKNLLKCGWSRNMDLVCAGSADRVVHIWDANTTEIAYQLPGHMGSVNEVCFHPSQAIIASCSTDKNIWLGELA